MVNRLIDYPLAATAIASPWWVEGLNSVNAVLTAITLIGGLVLLYYRIKKERS